MGVESQLSSIGHITDQGLELDLPSMALLST